MTLAEKMEVAAEEAEGDEDHAAENLKKSLTPAEKQSVWSKHQTHLKHNPKEAKALKKASKNEKRVAAAKWLMQKDGKKYLTTAAKVAASQALKKAEEWQSEKAILKRWSPQELQAHLASGRVVWREDPYTPGVFEYQDTQNWSREVKRSKKWETGVDHEPEAEALDQFAHLYDNEALSMGAGEIGSYKGKRQSLGKGKNRLAKGGGKAKGKRHPHLLAIEDGAVEDGDQDEEGEEEEDEEAKVKEALKKVRKARDMITTTQSNLEEALKKAKSQLSTKGKGNALQLQLKLERQLKALKEVLLKKGNTSNGLKKLLEEAATVVKSAKDEVKELQLLANRATSVSGRSNSSRGNRK